MGKVSVVFNTSGVRVVGVNAEEIYLALNRTETELIMRDVGLLLFCPRRRIKRGRPPTIQFCALDENNTKRFKPWLQPAEESDENAAKKMVITDQSFENSHFVHYKNHLLRFDNKVKLHSKRGFLVQLYMVRWTG